MIKNAKININHCRNNKLINNCFKLPCNTDSNVYSCPDYINDNNFSKSFNKKILNQEKEINRIIIDGFTYNIEDAKNTIAQIEQYLSCIYELLVASLDQIMKTSSTTGRTELDHESASNQVKEYAIEIGKLVQNANYNGRRILKDSITGDDNINSLIFRLSNHRGFVRNVDSKIMNDFTIDIPNVGPSSLGLRDYELCGLIIPPTTSEANSASGNNPIQPPVIIHTFNIITNTQYLFSTFGTHTLENGFDTRIALYNDQGEILDQDDDDDDNSSQDEAAQTDSFIYYEFQTPGVYYLGIGTYLIKYKENFIAEWTVGNVSIGDYILIAEPLHLAQEPLRLERSMGVGQSVEWVKIIVTTPTTSVKKSIFDFTSSPLVYGSNEGVNEPDTVDDDNVDKSITDYNNSIKLVMNEFDKMKSYRYILCGREKQMKIWENGQDLSFNHKCKI
jgi:hypothetical protein